MKTYDKDGTCIKCGYGGIEDVHQDAVSEAYAKALTGFDRAFVRGAVTIPRKPIPEHIFRTCKNCGYSWREKPLDDLNELKAQKSHRLKGIIKDLKAAGMGHLEGLDDTIKVRKVHEVETINIHREKGHIVVDGLPGFLIDYIRRNGLNGKFDLTLTETKEKRYV